MTLERGVTHDIDFEQWPNKVWNFGSGLGADVSLKDFRKDVVVEVYNEAGQLAIAYKVFRCWVSDSPSPDAAAAGSAGAPVTQPLRGGVASLRAVTLAGRRVGRARVVAPDLTPTVRARLTAVDNIAAPAGMLPAPGTDDRGHAASVGHRRPRGHAEPRVETLPSRARALVGT